MMNIKTTNSSPIIAQIIFAFATLAFIIVVFAAAVFFAFGGPVGRPGRRRGGFAIDRSPHRPLCHAGAPEFLLSKVRKQY